MFDRAVVASGSNSASGRGAFVAFLLPVERSLRRPFKGLRRKNNVIFGGSRTTEKPPKTQRNPTKTLLKVVLELLLDVLEMTPRYPTETPSWVLKRGDCKGEGGGKKLLISLRYSQQKEQ